MHAVFFNRNRKNKTDFQLSQISTSTNPSLGQADSPKFQKTNVVRSFFLGLIFTPISSENI